MKSSNKYAVLVVSVVIMGILSILSMHNASMAAEQRINNRMTIAQAPGGFTTTVSGLQYKDAVVGTGATPRTGQTVSVHYTGYLTNGTKFDSSVDRGQPFQFQIGEGQVIKGWDEGVGTMHVGGKRRLIIPPDLGYGSNGAGNAIPPNATLVFDVQLLGVQ
jgi:FKBP-type peptidyl-prolyl cis-trans isomerase